MSVMKGDEAGGPALPGLILLPLLLHRDDRHNRSPRPQANMLCFLLMSGFDAQSASVNKDMSNTAKITV